VSGSSLICLPVTTVPVFTVPVSSVSPEATVVTIAVTTDFQLHVERQAVGHAHLNTVANGGVEIFFVTVS
jgi:hypothetical protein